MHYSGIMLIEISRRYNSTHSLNKIAETDIKWQEERLIMPMNIPYNGYNDP